MEYKHKITGLIGDYTPEFAAIFPELEPVDPAAVEVPTDVTPGAPDDEKKDGE